MSDQWYEDKIEPPLQGIVKELRNNGVNTECSCGHDMYIQCQYIIDGHIAEIHHIVWTYLAMNKGIFGYETVDFDIELHHQVRDGHSYTSLEIKFPITKSEYERLEKKKKYYEEQINHINETLKNIKE